MRKVAVIANTPPEFQTFVQEAEKLNPVSQKIVENRLIAETKIAKFPVLVVLSDDQGSAIQDTVSWIDKRFGAKIYVNVGTAGIYQPGEVKQIPLLDVVIPRRVFCYDFIKIRKGKAMDLGNPLCPSRLLLHVAEQAAKKLVQTSGGTFGTHFIHELSGPINWSDKDSLLIEGLLKRYVDLVPLGVDMESHAFLSQIEKLCNPTVHAIIIRGLPDNILEEDNQSQRDQHRDPAATNAATFAISFIKKLSDLSTGTKAEVIHDIQTFLTRTHAIEIASMVGTVVSLIPIFFHLGRA